MSRHVKQLEAELGVALFRRLPQGLELTDAGRKLPPVLTSAFENIGRQARQIAGEGNDLRIICPPTLSIRWLIPRLDRFRALHPSIQVRLTTRFLDGDDFASGNFDLAIGMDVAIDWSQAIRSVPLFPMIVVPACAPALLR